MGGRGGSGSRNTEGATITGVSSEVMPKYRAPEFSKHGVDIKVNSYEATELIRDGWNGEPNDVTNASMSILNSYMDKNSLKPTSIEVSRYSVAMNMPDGSRIYTVLAEPSGFAQKNMSAYIRLYQKVNGKKKQIKKSEW